MAGLGKYWGMTVVTLLLNIGSLVWASYLANESTFTYTFNYNDPNYNDYNSTEEVNDALTKAIAYPLIVAALMNLLGSAFVFHGLHKKNNCSLVWYIVLNSIAITDQLLFGFSGLVLGYSTWSSYGYNYSGNVITIDNSSLNPRNLGYFMIPLVIFSMVATIMIGQYRKQIRNEMIAQRLAANQPQVIMVPGATFTTTQQMQPQYQQGQQYQMQYQQGQQYPMQYQQGQMQYPMPQQNQQQGNLPPQYTIAPGTNQQYGTSNPAYAETKPIGY